MVNNYHLYTIKYAHRQGYHATLQDNINLLNYNASQTDEAVKYKQEAEVKKLEKFYIYLSVLLVVTLIPLVTHAANRRIQVYQSL